MSNAQEFVTSFMTQLAGSDVTLTPALQNVFAKILAAHVVVDTETNVVSFKSAFENLSKIFTFIATPADERTTLATTDQFNAAKTAAAAENDLTVGGDAPVDPELPTDEPTEEPTDGPTDEPTEEPGVEGETFSLTTGADTIRPATTDDLVQEVDEEGNPVGEPTLVAPEGVQFSTENDDTITGAITSRSSTTTFQRDDKIDGGEGFDTLKLSIDGDFRGFSDNGGLTNVERIELENVGGRNRYFDAAGIEGVEEWALYANKDNAIALRKLADANITVEVHGQTKGSLELGFESGATLSSREDTMNLVLNNVGTAADWTDCSNPKKEEVVSLKSEGLGQLNNLNINSVGSLNLFDLGGSANTTVTLEGNATTDLSGFSKQLKAFDASAATGKVTANLSNVTTKNLGSIQGGAGDDTFTVAAGGLATTATIDGGEGANSLVIETSTTLNTIKPTMQNIQTLQVNGASGLLTLAGENVEGLETVVYNMKNDASRLLLSGLENDTLNLILNGGSDGRVTYTGEGELMVSTEAGEGNPTDCDGELLKTHVETTSAKVVASQAEAVTFNVSAYSQYTGEMTAGAAEEVTLVVESGLYNEKHTSTGEATKFTGILNANEASVVTIDAEGYLGGNVKAAKAEELSLSVSAQGNSLILEANEAQEMALEVSGDKEFDLTAASNLNKVQELSVTTSGKAGIKTTMEALNNATIAGTGSFFVGTSYTAAEAAKEAGDGTAAKVTLDFSGLALDEAWTITSLNNQGTLDGTSNSITFDDLKAALEASDEIESVTGDLTAAVITYAVDADGTNTGAAFTVDDTTNNGPVEAGGTGIAITAGVDGTAQLAQAAIADFTSADVGKVAQDVAVDASDLLGDFAIKVVGFNDAGTANGTAEIFGSKIGTNIIEVVGRNDVEITTGLADDQITVDASSFDSKGNPDTKAVADVVLTGGLGKDTFVVTASAGKAHVVITDFEVSAVANSGDLLKIGTSAASKAASTTAEAAELALETTFSALSNVDADKINKVEIKMQSATVTGFEYNGTVYYDTANVLVELQGLSEADYSSVDWII